MTRVLNIAVVALVAFGLQACATAGSSPQSVAGAQLAGKPVDPALAQAGARVFVDEGCSMCHTFGRRLAGPDLLGVTEFRDADWLRKWLKDTNAMIDGDPVGQALVKQWKGVKMPEVDLNDRQIEALMHYMAAESARIRARGE